MLFRLTTIVFFLVAYANAINYGTWNLRYLAPEDTTNGNVWSKRSPHIIDFIRFYDLDILTSQEVSETQVACLLDSLTDYRSFKIERKNENPIFFKKDHFSVLDSGEFYLSKTPEKRGWGWDADCIRNCVWLKLKDLKSGVIFFVFNTHLDHKGKTARKESVRLLISKVKKIAKGFPFLLSGDLNMTQNDQPYKDLLKSGIFTEAQSVAKYVSAPTGSFNNFNPQTKPQWLLDHILVSKNIDVYRYGILNPLYYDEIIRSVSDHLPVIIKWEYIDEKSP